MCDSAEGNWVWTVRRRASGQAVQTAEGYTYFFAEEDDARRLVERLHESDLELVQVREPGA